jgi:signal transduction histidine kinase
MRYAVKYSPKGGRIVIGVSEERSDDRGWAVVTFSDDGVGIPEQDLPHIFERYRRGSNVGDQTAGAGIGLAGARQIVQQHGGTLEVESAENQGSTFTIRLPLSPP